MCGVTERGIRWKRQPGEIESLNARMRAIADKFLRGETVKPANTTQADYPEINYVLQYNPDVYKKRWILVPIVIATVSISVLLVHVLLRPMITLASLTIMFFYYDLFSGVLHIVLDEPAFIGTPVIGDGCLEFQWHHHIPDDLAQKSYLEVCGDLNLALFIIGLKDLVLFRGTSAVPLCLWASKMLMAYFGQLCHVMSHTPKAKRPEWVIALQDAGVMLSAKEHLIHHTKYDGNFCIGSGVFNPLLSTLRPYGDKYTWLVVFLLCGVFDVYLFEKMIELFV